MASFFGYEGAMRALSGLMSGTLWMALGTGIAPDGSGRPVLIGEPVPGAGGYQRAAFGAVTIANGAAENQGTITFPTPTASIGQMTHGAIFDAQTGGNVLALGPLSQLVDWAAGSEAPTIAAGNGRLTPTLAG